MRYPLYLQLTMLAALSLCGCKENTVPPTKTRLDSVMDFQLNEFTAQNATLPFTLKKLATAVHDQSDGKLSFNYSIAQSDLPPGDANRIDELSNISISLSKPTVSEAFKWIMSKSHRAYQFLDDGTPHIYEWTCQLDNSLHVHAFPTLPKNTNLFRESAVTNSNNLEPLLISAGVTFAPGAYAQFDPKRNLITSKNTLDQNELTQHFIEAFDEQLKSEMLQAEEKAKKIPDPFAE